MPKTQQQLQLPCTVLCNPGQMCQTSMLTEQLSKSLLGVYGIFLSPWHLALVDSDLPEQLCQLLVFLHIACCIWIFKSPFLCAAVTRRKIDAMLDQPPQVTVAHLQQKGPRYVKHLRLWQGQRPPAESKDGSTV